MIDSNLLNSNLPFQEDLIRCFCYPALMIPLAHAFLKYGQGNAAQDRPSFVSTCCKIDK